MDTAFAGLLLDDSGDERAPNSSREARIARAFEQSKNSYASEVVVTPPGWFQIDRVQTEELTKLEARSVEWSVQRLYLQRSYEAALQLAVQVLLAGGVELRLGGAVGTSLAALNTHHDVLAKNEARDREMLDIAIRCSVKLGNRTIAEDLAEATRARWANSPGLAYTAGEAFLFAGRPFDAISALLHSVRARTPSYSALALLAQALNTAAQSPQTGAAALAHLGIIIGQYAERIKPAFERGLFPGESSNSKPPPKSKSTILSDVTVRTIGEEAGMSEVDLNLLVALCCVGDTEQELGMGERSVRSL